MENEHHVEDSNVIIENVKIHETMFVETYICEEWLELL
jgi:hypothetical protein